MTQNRPSPEALASGLSTLRPRLRVLAERAYLEGVPQNVLAAELGVSEPRVSQLLSLARRQLVASPRGPMPREFTAEERARQARFGRRAADVRRRERARTRARVFARLATVRDGGSP